MSPSTNYTTYVPEKPLNEQVEILEAPIHMQSNLMGIPYNWSCVVFKPLKVNDIFLKVLYIHYDEVGLSRNGFYIYEKYIFSVKSIDSDKINLIDIPVTEIEAVIKRIFQSSDLTSEFLKLNLNQ